MVMYVAGQARPARLHTHTHAPLTLALKSARASRPIVSPMSWKSEALKDADKPSPHGNDVVQFTTPPGPVVRQVLTFTPCKASPNPNGGTDSREIPWLCLPSIEIFSASQLSRSNSGSTGIYLCAAMPMLMLQLYLFHVHN
eukprot:COSAG01_NODE_21058_length_920_cov_1.866017_1_plen_140_part_10